VLSDHRNAPLRFHQLWLVIGWSIVFLVIYLSLNSGGMQVVSGMFNDKMSHALGYCGLMLWFAQLYKSLGQRLLLAVLFVVMGIVLEFLQRMGGVRVFEIADMMANATGILIGWLAARLGLDRLLAWFEVRVLARQ